MPTQNEIIDMIVGDVLFIFSFPCF